MYVQKMYISHACIAINEELWIWMYMDMDECRQMWMNENSSIIIKHHSFVPMLHSSMCYYLTHIVINNTKPSTHSFMWLKLIHIAEIIIYIIKHVSLHALI
jgi:hypothetical protein